MKTKSNTTKKKTSASKSKENTFPIVAIGASSGGLEAMSLLLENLPEKTGMAYIFVQHLSRDHKSMLPALLSKSTKMKVQVIEKMELMKPNNVYVIPYNKNIKVTNGHIQLIPRPKNVSPNLSIDLLFSSLAKTHKENVVGIILSGNASDGTKGLKAIKKAGGVTFAQDDTAKYSSMPTSAINAGVVDHIMSPKEIGKKLALLGKNSSTKQEGKTQVVKNTIQENDPELNTIFGILSKRTGVDFSHYKMTTIKRRIERRIQKNNLKTVKEYTRLLTDDHAEAESLHADLLINVTSFFRDTETFSYLKKVILPLLLKTKKKGETLRIWVPACATGQEAYSIAMLLTEIQDQQKVKIPVRIFATDLSEQAIKGARQGEYTKSELKSIPAARIERFFEKLNGKYRIIQDLRELCVFGTSHNILHDPPFSRMDFISCRNLLIYFDAAAQQQVLTSFHFSLNDQGYLMLGKSETTGPSSQQFTQLNSKYKIYSRKRNARVRKVVSLSPRHVKTVVPEKRSKSTVQKNPPINFPKLDQGIDSILLSSYMPACAIINTDMEIIQFRGSTSLFLSHPSGKASLNILKMTRPEFAFELRNAIQKATKTKQAVRTSDIEIKIDSVFRTMSLEVQPLTIDFDESLLLIVFTLQKKELHTGNVTAKGNSNVSELNQKERRIKKLTDELSYARSEMHTVIETQETAYEELQTANEEIVSSNEEFQTLNEELESTKEEIEAANDELIFNNQELKKQNELLEESYNYSQTIIATIHEPLIILDNNLNVKSVNKSFYEKFKVSQREVEGKSLFELGNKQWDIPKLRELLKAILNKNINFENFEVSHVFKGIGEKVMLLNASKIIQKTHKEKLILLAIKDVTERVLLQRKVDEKNKEDIRLHQKKAHTLEDAAEDRTRQLEQKNEELERANTELFFQNGEKEKRAAELSIANIELAFQNNEKEKLAAELITANKELAFQNHEKEKRAAELIIANTELAFQNAEKEKRALELSNANRDLTAFTYISSHDLQEPLRKIQIFANCILEEEKSMSDKGTGYFTRLMATANRMQQLIEDLLKYSRAKSGDRVFENTDLNAMLDEVKKIFEENIQNENVIFTSTNLPSIQIIPFQFRQLLHNLVSNSIKFAKKNVPVHIDISCKIALGSKLENKYLSPKKKYCHLTFSDNGIGFDPQYKERIFEVFQRLHSKEAYSGTGIGLAICKRIIENHNGIIEATGELNKGARFDMYILVQ